MVSARRASQQWFSVQATYKAVHSGAERRAHTWERIVFLVSASDLEHAAVAARSEALAKEHDYVAVNGERVRWVFQEIEAIQALLDASLQTGTEVWSYYFRRIDRSPG